MIFSKYTQLCNHHHHLILKHFNHPIDISTNSWKSLISTATIFSKPNKFLQLNRQSETKLTFIDLYNQSSALATGRKCSGAFSES